MFFPSLIKLGCSYSVWLDYAKQFTILYGVYPKHIMDFRHYKSQLRNIFNNVSNHLQPIDFTKTLNATYNSCFRLPTYTFEPYFIWSLGPPANAYIVDEIRENANAIRSAAAKHYSLHTPDPTLNRITFARALDAVRELMGLVGTSFDPLDIATATSIATKSTSSGAPDFKKKSEISEMVEKQAVISWSERDDSFLDLPVTLAWRTQVRKTGLKFRLIWLVPFLIVIYETVFFYPIIGYISDIRTTSYCIGNVYNDLANRFNALQKYDNILSLDYERYDSSISPFFINLFFSFMKEHLRVNSAENWLYECIRRFHLNALVITGSEGEARIFRKRNGLLSGSVVTNILGSFVNLFCICYFLIDHNIEPTIDKIHVMGDDVLIGTGRRFSITYVAKYFKDKFGILVSIKKSEIFKPGQPVYFLGAYFDNKKRYINFNLIREQLKVTTSFVDIPEFERVFSKLCSSLFKYTDGWRYFYDEVPKLLEYFGRSNIPEFYLDMSTPAGGPTISDKLKSVYNTMYNGWRLQ